MLPENQVVKLTAAQKAARKAIESTYSGVCTIIERRDVRDEKTKITRKNQGKARFKNRCGTKRRNNRIFRKWCSRRLPIPCGNHA